MFETTDICWIDREAGSRNPLTVTLSIEAVDLIVFDVDAFLGPLMLTKLSGEIACR